MRQIYVGFITAFDVRSIGNVPEPLGDKHVYSVTVNDSQVCGASLMAKQIVCGLAGIFREHHADGQNANEGSTQTGKLIGHGVVAIAQKLLHYVRIRKTAPSSEELWRQRGEPYATKVPACPFAASQ
jgi:hypothetical protein